MSSYISATMTGSAQAKDALAALAQHMTGLEDAVAEKTREHELAVKALADFTKRLRKVPTPGHIVLGVRTALELRVSQLEDLLKEAELPLESARRESEELAEAEQQFKLMGL